MSNVYTAQTRWVEVGTAPAYHEALMIYGGHSRALNSSMDLSAYALVIRAASVRMYGPPPPQLTSYTLESHVVRLGDLSMSMEDNVRLTNPEGTLLAMSTTTNCFLEASTRKMVKLSAKIVHEFFPEPSTPSKDALACMAAQRVPCIPPMGEDVFKYKFFTRHSDLDANGHITNGKFVLFFDDALIAGEKVGRFNHGARDVTGFDIVFNKELEPMQEVTILGWFEEDKRAYAFALRQDDLVVATSRMYVGSPNNGAKL